MATEPRERERAGLEAWAERYAATPERPTSITFGKDQKTLYVTGHHSLYEVAIP